MTKDLGKKIGDSLRKSHVIEKSVSEPNDHTLGLNPIRRLRKTFFDLEQAGWKINWKIRANLLVKTCIVFFLLSVSVASYFKS